jgi:Spermine/spermidine synthase domain
MTAELTMRKWGYAGLFLVALATLMYEILLTRIFSVTMWYHFAFVAISVAMFGMTVGAILVYLIPRYFTHEHAKHHLALSSLLFAVSIVISFLTHLCIPFVMHKSIVGVYSIALTYVIISVPFIFSGICVCLALTKFPHQVSKLYAFDLAGAALGCILLIYLLRITDGPTAVIVVALLASISTIFFGTEAGNKKLGRLALLSSLLLAGFALANTALVHKQSGLLQLLWMKGGLNSRPLYEKWNSFSLVRVRGDPSRPEKPFGWGLSHTYPADRKVHQLLLDIDANAGTVLTAFDGDWNEVEHLKYDVTNLAHYIRPAAKVLVIGTGGGRDVLSALTFGQKSVLGVEINDDIIDAVNHRFGEFTGHLDRDPRVTFVNDEARSYISRQPERFDIIQVSLIDTWAATTAGAFVLTEHSLYTVEAWKTFLNRLTPAGVLTFSRWYQRGTPGEVYRLTSLACASLAQSGVENPRDHIIIVRHMQHDERQDLPNWPAGVGTMLVSQEPFSAQDLDTLEEVVRTLQFDIVLSPRFSLDPAFATIASGRDLEEVAANFPINISPPTDDDPFFFHMLRFRDMFDREKWRQPDINFKGVFTLGALLIIVVGLTLLCIIIPLILTTGGALRRGAWPFFIYFAGIGLGFMLVEISQMQRLIIFLGHPTYSLTVVLFALLLSSGLGSYWTQRVNTRSVTGSWLMSLALLLCVLMTFGLLTPYAIHIFQESRTTLRILVAVAILFPLGLFMGMAFPLGMKAASAKFAFLTPWLWGINGATSVCASVLAIAIALSLGIAASFWTGFLSYVIAFGAFVWLTREKGVLRSDI